VGKPRDAFRARKGANTRKKKRSLPRGKCGRDRQ
jgi:hypothetical protein